MNKILILGLITLSMCSLEKPKMGDCDYVKVKLNAKSSIKYLTDSTFLGDITSIYKNNGKIILVDSRLRRIISLSHNLRLENVFGKNGKGPGEFSNIKNLFIHNDTIIISDTGKRKMHYFEQDGLYIHSIQLDNELYPIERFCIDDQGSFYISKTNVQFPIMKFDKSGHFISGFGNEIMKLKSSFEITNPDYFYLFIYDNTYLLAVSRNRPIIAIFDRKTEKLIKSLNLSENELFRGRIEFIDPMIKTRPEGYYNFFSDAFLENDRLFLAYYTSHNSKAKCKNILELNLKNNPISISKSYQLNDDVWIGSMCVSGSDLFIYDLKYSNFLHYRL